jgi:hypothetical protein
VARRVDPPDSAALVERALRAVRRLPSVHKGEVSERLGERLDLAGRSRLLAFDAAQPGHSPRGWGGVVGRTALELARQLDDDDRDLVVDAYLHRLEEGGVLESWPPLTGLFPRLSAPPSPPWSLDDPILWLNSWIPAGDSYDTVIDIETATDDSPPADSADDEVFGDRDPERRIDDAEPIESEYTAQPSGQIEYGPEPEPEPEYEPEYAEAEVWYDHAGEPAGPGGLSEDMRDQIHLEEMVAAELGSSDDTLAQSRVDTEPAAADPAVVNLGFAERASRRVIRRSDRLRPDQDYWLWLEIGPQLEASIDDVPTSLPADLPEGTQLRVVVFPFPGELVVEPGASQGVLRLRRDGSAIVTTPVQPDLGPRGGRLFFPVRTPSTGGRHRVRVSIYAANVVVQSRVVSAVVRSEPGRGGLRSHFDYRLTRSLASMDLDGLKDHALSVLANDDSDGSHHFTFVGAHGIESSAHFSDSEIQDLITSTRAELRKIAWGTDQLWSGEPYQFAATASPADRLTRLAPALIRLAHRGYRTYDLLVDRLSGGTEQVDRLEDAIATPGMVQ